jgi:xylulokinase
MGETGALVTKHGDVLAPLVSWLDTRAAAETHELKAKLGAERLYEITGHRIDLFWGLPRLMWLRRHRADDFARSQVWLPPADLATFWLSGEAATSPSLASRTMALDESTLTWSDEMLAAAEIPRTILPPVVVSGTPVGRMTSKAARLSGLPAGLPVVVGGHDRLCGALAARVGHREIPVDSAGTAETVVVVADRRPDPATAFPSGINCYADVTPGQYAYSARVGLSGALLEWVRRELFAAAPSADELVERVPAPISFGGVLCYPAFGRPITPSIGLDAVPGALLGLTLEHTRIDIVRAVLESTAFSLRANVEALESQLGSALAPVRVEGRIADVDKVMQLRADILSRPVESVDIQHATAVGAALLAAVGAGACANVPELGAILRPNVRRWHPDPARAAAYEEVYTHGFRELGPRRAAGGQITGE